jgi:hypothetical protein
MVESSHLDLFKKIFRDYRQADSWRRGEFLCPLARRGGTAIADKTTNSRFVQVARTEETRVKIEQGG